MNTQPQRIKNLAANDEEELYARGNHGKRRSTGDWEHVVHAAVRGLGERLEKPCRCRPGYCRLGALGDVSCAGIP